MFYERELPQWYKDAMREAVVDFVRHGVPYSQTMRENDSRLVSELMRELPGCHILLRFSGGLFGKKRKKEK